MKTLDEVILGTFSIRSKEGYSKDLIDMKGFRASLEEFYSKNDEITDRMEFFSEMFSNESLIDYSTEGAWDSIKAFFKKIIDGIIWLFKKLIELAKKFWSWMTGIFKKTVETVAKKTYDEIYRMEPNELKEYEVKIRPWKNLSNFPAIHIELLDALRGLSDSIINSKDGVSQIFGGAKDLKLRYFEIYYENMKEHFKKILGDTKGNDLINQISNDVLDNKGFTEDDIKLYISGVYYNTSSAPTDEITVTADQVITKENLDFLKTKGCRILDYSKEIKDTITTMQTHLNQLEKQNKSHFEEWFEHQYDIDHKFKDNNPYEPLDHSTGVQRRNQVILFYKWVIAGINIQLKATESISRIVADQILDIKNVARQILNAEKK